MCSSYHTDQFKFFISPGECLQFVFLSTDPDTMHLIPFCLYPRKDVRSAGGRVLLTVIRGVQCHGRKSRVPALRSFFMTCFRSMASWRICLHPTSAAAFLLQCAHTTPLGGTLLIPLEPKSLNWLHEAWVLIFGRDICVEL